MWLKHKRSVLSYPSGASHYITSLFLAKQCRRNVIPTPSWEYVLITQWNIPLYTDWAWRRTYKCKKTCEIIKNKKQLSHMYWFQSVMQPSQCLTDILLQVPVHLQQPTTFYFSTFRQLLLCVTFSVVLLKTGFSYLKCSQLRTPREAWLLQFQLCKKTTVFQIS